MPHHTFSAPMSPEAYASLAVGARVETAAGRLYIVVKAGPKPRFATPSSSLRPECHTVFLDRGRVRFVTPGSTADRAIDLQLEVAERMKAKATQAATESLTARTHRV